MKSQLGLNLLYQKLEKYKYFDKDPKNCERFLEVVDEIVLRKDPDSISILVKYFDDKSDYSWVLESLRCAIESYPDNIYVEKILENFDNMWVAATECTQDLFYMILNNPQTFLILKELIIKKTPGNLCELLEKIKLESPHHSPLIEELKCELINFAP